MFLRFIGFVLSLYVVPRVLYALQVYGGLGCVIFVGVVLFYQLAVLPLALFIWGAFS